MVLLVAAGAVTAIWLIVVVAWRDAPFSLTFDDAFYYFGIARNVAHGHGSTFDGIDLTNGYHPLWMLMAVPVYALGLDGTSAVRVLLVVQVLCYGGALALVGWTCARAIDGWPRLVARRGSDAGRAGTWCAVVVALALVAAAADPFIVKVFVNGMESGVLVLLDAAVLAIGATWRGRFLRRGTPSARWATGLLLAGLVLARTDSVLLVAVMGLWALAEARSSGWRRSVVPLVQLFALPAVVLIGYLVSNQLLFGVLLQISGLTKRAPFTLERVIWFGLAALVAALIGRWGYRRARTTRARSRFGRVGGFAASTAWFASFCVLLVAYYQVFQTQQWLWYYVPLAIYLLFLLVIGVADFAEAAVVEAPDAGVGPRHCCRSAPSCWCRCWRGSCSRRVSSLIRTVIRSPSPTGTQACGSTATCRRDRCWPRGTPASSGTTPTGRSSTSTGWRTRTPTTRPAGTGR